MTFLINLCAACASVYRMIVKKIWYIVVVAAIITLVFFVHSLSISEIDGFEINSEKVETAVQLDDETIPLVTLSPERLKGLINVLGVNPTKEECPTDRVLTAIPGGRLGNQIWEYASIWAMVKVYSNEEKLVGYSTNETLNSLANVFERMSLPALGSLPSRCLDLKTARILRYNKRPKLDRNMKIKPPIVLDYWAARYADVLDVGLDKFRQEFRFKQKLLENSQLRLLDAKAKLNRTNEANTTFIGIHHRGTDYPRHLGITYKNAKIVTPGFYASAMNFMRKRHNNTLFVVASDDRKWCQENINGSDVVVAEKNDAGNDLALLSSCNHSIVSYGTFGTSAAVLAGGETVLFNVDQKEDDNGAKLSTSISNYLDYWYAIE